MAQEDAIFPGTESEDSAGNNTGNNAADPWSTATPPEDSSTDWLNQSEQVETTSNTLLDPFQNEWIDLQSGVEQGIDWLGDNFRVFFQLVNEPVQVTLSMFDTALLNIPPLLLIAIFALLAWQLSGLTLAVSAAIGLVVIGAIGVWNEAMTTLSMVITSVVFCVVLGIPLGIWMARSEGVTRVLRPLLDAMQTTPAFVYLVPIVMLFGIGNVPGVIVTIIFALPPVVRLTSLGIKQVPENLVEASRSFGASPRQLLFKVQLPLAMPSIMAGINQTLMMALSMVVIASMIAVPGLGLLVLRGIGRLDIGLATVGGIGIVILAIVLDRMTQALGRDMRDRGARHWYHTGPAGILYRLKQKIG